MRSWASRRRLAARSLIPQNKLCSFPALDKAADGKAGAEEHHQARVVRPDLRQQASRAEPASRLAGRSQELGADAPTAIARLHEQALQPQDLLKGVMV